MRKKEVAVFTVKRKTIAIVTSKNSLCNNRSDQLHHNSQS